MNTAQSLKTALKHHNANELKEAEAIYRTVLKEEPNHPEALHLLGCIANRVGRSDAAVKLFRKSIANSPNRPEVYINLAVALRAEGELDDAESSCRKAIELNPTFLEAHGCLGYVLTAKNELPEAMQCYDRVLTMKRDHPGGHWNRALNFLLEGKYEEGWKEYEWRWKYDGFPSPKRNFTEPLWTGAPMPGKTILLHAEQGQGDAIQFVRYAPLVAARFNRVIVECNASLMPLFKSLPGVAQVIEHKAHEAARKASDMARYNITRFDVQCPLLSLPLAMRTTLERVPANIPYLSAPPALVKEWSKRIPRDRKLNVGIAWGGDPNNKRDRARSIKLDSLAPLAMKGVRLISLQKGEAAKQTQILPPGMKLLDLTNDLNDFADTAALIMNLDLIISVDTSIVHLAGALGKRVWTMLPFSPDWRWMLNRTDSPWYPTMKLFRQSKSGDYTDVIANVTRELSAMTQKLKSVISVTQKRSLTDELEGSANQLRHCA